MIIIISNVYNNIIYISGRRRILCEMERLEPEAQHMGTGREYPRRPPDRPVRKEPKIGRFAQTRSEKEGETHHPRRNRGRKSAERRGQSGRRSAANSQIETRKT